MSIPRVGFLFYIMQYEGSSYLSTSQEATFKLSNRTHNYTMLSGPSEQVCDHSPLALIGKYYCIELILISLSV